MRAAGGFGYPRWLGWSFEPKVWGIHLGPISLTLIRVGTSGALQLCWVSLRMWAAGGGPWIHILKDPLP